MHIQNLHVDRQTDTRKKINRLPFHCLFTMPRNNTQIQATFTTGQHTFFSLHRTEERLGEKQASPLPQLRTVKFIPEVDSADQSICTSKKRGKRGKQKGQEKYGNLSTVKFSLKCFFSTRTHEKATA